MRDKKGLPRPPLFTSDYIAMAEILQFAMERFGQLVFALMCYTADGTLPDDLPDDLRMMFSVYKLKIDAAREKYEQRCATNAKNGGIGGKTKAENAKKSADFKPPTLKQFHDAVTHYLDTGDIEDADTYDVDNFFDQLKDAGWSIGGEPIQRRGDWESALLARFGVVPKSFPHQLYYKVFEKVYSTLHAQRDSEGRSCADDIACDFFDYYDEATKTWNVDGEQLCGLWAALSKFLKQYTENIPT